MATYVIGDVHACLKELKELLKKINYDENKDKLIFVGDLINRGKYPVETLEFIKSLKNIKITLGNHDLTLLATARGAIPNKTDRENRFDEILNLDADRLEDILLWLEAQELAIYEQEFNALIVHAGVYPKWSLEELLKYANEITSVLHSEKKLDLYKSMYGNSPAIWDYNLTGWDRLRFIINSLTRMRFLDLNFGLDLTVKGDIDNCPENHKPWFKLKNSLPVGTKIYFGHWAALRGKTDTADMFAVDTGCVWGNSLTAIRLEDNQSFEVAAKA